MIENSLVIEMYNKWLSICAINEGSMGNVYDFKALDFIFNNYNLTIGEREDCLDKLIIITNTVQEMNKTAKDEYDRIKQRFDNKDRLKAKSSKIKKKPNKKK